MRCSTLIRPSTNLTVTQLFVLSTVVILRNHACSTAFSPKQKRLILSLVHWVATIGSLSARSVHQILANLYLTGQVAFTIRLSPLGRFDCRGYHAAGPTIVCKVHLFTRCTIYEQTWRAKVRLDPVVGLISICAVLYGCYRLISLHLLLLLLPLLEYLLLFLSV